jgi:L-ascorbate metabolism protein UlaG (beta-lactamase superfamily)
MKTLKFLGHACFLLSDGKTSIIFDPFLTGNPSAAAEAADIDCQYILPSHCHGDHIGDTVAIAKRTGATVVSTAEVANSCGEKGCKAHGMHLGGKHAFDFGYVRLTLAFHGSGVPGGHACGFVVNFGGTTVYHAGDTALFGDMALLGRLEKIDYALLPIGDNYTMGPADAAEAVALLKPRFVVPMHYNTWPLIAQDPQAFKKNVEARLAVPVLVVKPGETLDLK